MTIQVAQLSILVDADTTAAGTNLANLNAAFAQVAQQAASGANQEAASQAQVVSAIQGVVSAVNQQTAAMQQSTTAVTSSLDGLGQGAQRVTAQVGGIGAVGSRGLLQLNQALTASGQAIGPVTNGLYLMSSQLMAMPAQASAVQKAMLGIAAGVSAIAAAATAVGAPQVQALANLKTALQDSGKSWDEYADTVQHAIDVGAGFGQTQTEVTRSMAQFAGIIKDPIQLMQAYQVASDVAARRNISLATATDIVVRGMEGQSRGLKVLGIDMQLVAHPAEELAKAQEALKAAQTSASNATDSYNAALQRYQDGLTAAALRTNSLKEAENGLAQAQQHLNDLTARYAAEDLAIHVSHTEDAVNSLADAQQKLADIIAKQAVEAEQPKIDKVADATDRLTLAKARLAEINKSTASIGGLSPEDLQKLADASDKVLMAQEKLAAAQGGDIASAQQALRQAVDDQRKALDAQHDKQNQALADSASLISAQQAVKHATEDLANATRTAYLESIGQTPKQVQDAIDLRNAIDAVADAQNKVVIARSQDTSEAALRELTRANEIRDANEAITKAVQGVAQAHNNAAIEALHERDAYLTVVAARDAMVAAQEKVAAATEKVAKMQDAVDNQGQRVLDALAQKTVGTSAAMENTWAGMIRRWKADFLNWLADFGDGAGKWVALLGPVITSLFTIRLLMAGGAVAGGAEAAGGAAAGGAGMAGGLASIGAALGPLLLVGIAAGLVAYAVWDLHDKWEILKPKFLKGLDEIGSRFAGMAQDAKGWGESIRDNVAGGIMDIPSRVAGVGEDMKGWGGSLIDNVRDGAAGAWSNHLYPWLAGLGEKIKNAPGNAFHWLYDMGWNVLAGLWNGIVDFYNDHIGGPIGGLFSKIIDAGNFIFQTHSPSKVFHEMGGNIMEGLYNGIRDAQHMPLGVMSDVAKKLAGQPLTIGNIGVGGVDSAVAAHMGHGGGVTIVHNDVTLQVAGSVTTERDLVESVRNTLVEGGRSQGGNFLGGTA